MRRGALLLLSLVLTSCAAQLPSEKRWSTPTAAFLDAWQRRSDSTRTLAYLASADFESEGRQESFTLELFYHRPDTYMLRGRGALGATGFRARLVGDSITFLLNRENRGYAGLVEDYPDTAVVELWRLMHLALPFLVGNASLEATSGPEWRVALTDHGSRPRYLEVRDGEQRLTIYYGRYRNSYPFWHLDRVAGSAPDGRLALELRQRLHNPSLDSTVFELTLPPGTRPLSD